LNVESDRFFSQIRRRRSGVASAMPGIENDATNRQRKRRGTDGLDGVHHGRAVERRRPRRRPQSRWARRRGRRRSTDTKVRRSREGDRNQQQRRAAQPEAAQPPRPTQSAWRETPHSVEVVVHGLPKKLTLHSIDLSRSHPLSPDIVDSEQ